MSIGLYILIIVVILLLSWPGVFGLDSLLARCAFRRIVGKAKDYLDADKLKEMFKKYMENRRQKWAFKAYIGVVTIIIGGGGFIPLIKANIIAANEKGMIDLHFWIDNSVPTVLLIIALVLVTLGYFAFLYFTNRKYKDDIF